MRYDRCFRMPVLGDADASGARIDPTFWNMAFTGHASVKRCKFCFSMVHQLENVT